MCPIDQVHLLLQNVTFKTYFMISECPIVSGIVRKTAILFRLPNWENIDI
jgi:hypothetical protein